MFTQEQKQKIAEVLNAKNLNACPSCGKLKTFGIGAALVMFPLQENPKLGTSLGGPSYPCVPVLCSYCGVMLFYNVFTLELGEIFGLTSSSAKAATNG
jgi:hypothetical protein